jgi:hypothetical protein
VEGMNQAGVVVCIYGNVTTKPPVQLLYANKNILKKNFTLNNFIAFVLPTCFFILQRDNM